MGDRAAVIAKGGPRLNPPAGHVSLIVDENGVPYTLTEAGLTDQIITLVGLQSSGALATANVNGSLAAADFSKLATVPANGSIPGYYTTPVFDFLAAPGFHAFNTPLWAGKRFHPITGTLGVAIVTRTGSATGNMAVRLSQNGSTFQGSPATSSITTANVNAIAAPEWTSASLITLAVPDMTTYPIQLEVVTAITGPSVCTGFFILPGIYL
jgi:hypothetical protein